MMKTVRALIWIVAFGITSTGLARGGNVCSRSGACASVNPAHAHKFQCLINWLDTHGYPIRFMGGYRKTMIAGTNVWSKHAVGNALDINQTGRNIITHRFPSGVSGAASACGLSHGSGWPKPDTGHFEVP